MKLEIKHLAAYLPYEVETEYNLSIIRPEFPDEYRRKILNEKTISFCLEYSKPILRPLSDLTKEIEMPFGKIVPMEWMFKEDWTEWDGESDCPLFMKHTYLCASGKVFPKFLPFWIVQQLAEMHFDLFELIEKGLAIDINSIENHS